MNASILNYMFKQLFRIRDLFKEILLQRIFLSVRWHIEKVIHTVVHKKVIFLLFCVVYNLEYHKVPYDC